MFQAVVDSLERAPSIVIPLVREVPPEIVKRRPRPEKWSAHEHACHLAAVGPLFIERIDIMLREESPRIRPYNPNVDQEEDALLRMDLDEALDRFARERARLVDRLRGLSPADWERKAEHPEYSRYSVGILCRHAALHDMLHAYRIEEIALAPRGP
jgi:hypothetical protein